MYNMSGWYYDEDDYLKGGDVLISDENGYAGIVGPVAKDVKDVRMNTTVTAIDYPETNNFGDY